MTLVLLYTYFVMDKSQWRIWLVICLVLALISTILITIKYWATEWFTFYVICSFLFAIGNIILDVNDVK